MLPVWKLSEVRAWNPGPGMEATAPPGPGVGQVLEHDRIGEALMFNCGFCKNLTQAGEQGKLVVTSWRVKSYPAQMILCKRETDERVPQRPDAKNRTRLGRPGMGYEIAEEKRACPSCAVAVQGAPRPAEQKPERMRDDA